MDYSTPDIYENAEYITAEGKRVTVLTLGTVNENGNTRAGLCYRTPDGVLHLCHESWFRRNYVPVGGDF